MAWSRISAVVVLVAGSGVAAADGGVELRERPEAGQVSRVVVELKARGRLQPGPPGGVGRREEKPLGVRVEARFAFVERVLESRPGGPRRVARWVVQAAAARNGEVIPEESAIRPEVRLLVAEVREGAAHAYSPGGPLTRSELELVQGPADPLCLGGLLPGGPVAIGGRWKVGTDAARSLSGYDALAANGLSATLEALDDATAKVRLQGEVRGAVLGGEGTIVCDGSFRFDRMAGQIDRLDLKRSELRKPGAVEAGLDLTSTLSLERRPAEAPAELADAVVAALPSRPDPGLELLRFTPVGGRYTLLHDRNWHIFSETTKQAVLRWLDHGEVLAQCNLAAGPNAGRGRHQDLGQFRDDVRTALGRSFGRVVGQGDVEGAAAGGFRHKVAVAGRVGETGVLWLYYLVASPAGDQLLATFTLTDAQARRFADQDIRVIGSLEWKEPAAP